LNKNNLAVVNGQSAIATDDMFSDKRVELIRNTVAKGAPDETFVAFLDIARRRNLDPLAKQISLIRFGGQFTIITTIDGYRAIAEQTGQYVGSDAPVFTFSGETTKAGKNAPDTATVTVHKLINGNSYPFSATVYFEEYSTGQGNWSTMPRTMLAKVAESHALRKAFPAVMSGMYEESEMDQAIEGTARVVNQSTGEIHQQPQRPTATIAPENPDDAREAANKHFHAVLGKYGITEEEKRAFIRFGGIPSGSAKEMTTKQLHDAAKFIDDKQDSKAFMSSLLTPPVEPNEQKEEADTVTEEQTDMSAINAAVGAQWDAKESHNDIPELDDVRQ